MGCECVLEGVLIKQFKDCADIGEGGSIQWYEGKENCLYALIRFGEADYINIIVTAEVARSFARKHSISLTDLKTGNEIKCVGCLKTNRWKDVNGKKHAYLELWAQYVFRYQEKVLWQRKKRKQLL